MSEGVKPELLKKVAVLYRSIRKNVRGGATTMEGLLLSVVLESAE